MINLLDPTDVAELRAARINVRLRRFASLTFVAVAVVGTIYAVEFYNADKQYKNAISSSTAADQQLVAYASTKATAKQYQSNLTIAKKILGSEIVFSKFITELASSLPANTILDTLTLSTKLIGSTSGKPITTEMNAKAKSYNDIITLKSNLEKKTNLFSEVRITSTSLITNSQDDLTKRYPYAATFSVVIARQGGN